MLTQFKYRVFFDEKSLYSVCKYTNLDTNKQVTCIGTNLPIFKDVTYRFEIEEVNSAKYGLNYKVISWKEVVNETEEDIIKYLSCGLFKGITEKRAKKIFNAFGPRCLDILDDNINRLSEIKGIGPKTVETIKQSYAESRHCRELAKLLTPFDISANMINKIYVEFKSDALEIIKTKPYELCKVSGLTFPVVDTIGKAYKIPETDMGRIIAASDYILQRCMSFGNVCMEKVEYGLQLINTLNCPSINRQTVLSYVLALMKNKNIIYNKRVSATKTEEYFYYPPTFLIERQIADEIKLLLQRKEKPVKNIDNLIEQFSGDIQLDESQKEAIKIGVTKPIFIITGGPGTGKTTILKIIAQINQHLNKDRDNNIFLSPTGKAARRITESTGYPAQTIHSALKLFALDDEYSGSSKVDIKNAIKDSHIFVDEASMIDLWIMCKLISNIYNCTIGFIGDAHQLPSVRCGSILRDLINCDIIPCVQLEYIHRQSTDALNICDNAYNIKNGIKSLSTGDDFEIVENDNLEEIEKKIIDIASDNYSKYGVGNSIVLCPFKKGYGGVYRLNNILQSKLNEFKDLSVSISNGMKIYTGDPVIQLRNRDEIANGDTGIVTRVTDTEVSVQFYLVKIVTITYTHKEAAEQLSLAYALTIHKSQGSEYDAVAIPFSTEHNVMLKRNILYTGITRGKHKVSLIGSYNAFYKAIENNMIEDRHSMLASLINPDYDETKKKDKKDSIKPEDKTVYEQMKLPFIDD